jgi:SAM-dependent methyltransferase
MCNNSKFISIVNLGKHPLVNRLVEKKNLKQKDPYFQLHLKQCKQCKLAQLKEIIDSDEIYKKVDYLYFSSEMPNLDKYFKSYSSDLKKRFLKKNDLVVEIGCNDGLMLQNFKKDYNILGVDPATNVILRALKKNITSIPEFFTDDIAKKIVNEWGQAKLIYGNNCIAHLNNLKDVANGVSRLLKKGGVFVIECNYWGRMVQDTNYGLIYHDHFSYFSVQNLKNFGKKYGLHAFDAIVTDAQGGSLRIFLSKGKRKETSRYKKLLKQEIDNKLNSFNTSAKYRKKVYKTTNKLKKLINELKFKKKKIAGYGAAAKGMTIIKSSGIGKKHLDYFVDDSPAKQGLYTAGDKIPIISRGQANKKLPDYFIILAPNYAKFIIEKEKKFIAKGGKFIVPVGDINVVGK